MAVMSVPLGDSSISTQFSGFWFEPPDSDELPPGDATLFWTIFVLLVQKSLRLLEFVVVYCALMINAIN